MYITSSYVKLARTCELVNESLTNAISKIQKKPRRQATWLVTLLDPSSRVTPSQCKTTAPPATPRPTPASRRGAQQHQPKHDDAKKQKRKNQHHNLPPGTGCEADDPKEHHKSIKNNNHTQTKLEERALLLDLRNGHRTKKNNNRMNQNPGEQVAEHAILPQK